MKKKALITGISGQDGAYLSNLLLSKGYEVFGIERRTASNENFRLKFFNIFEKIKLFRIDLYEFNQVSKLIIDEQFDEIYNLAAQSFVGSSWDNPISTSNTNSLAVTNILDSIKMFSSKTKFYQASTSEMFGKIVQKKQSEDTPFYPRSPYGVSKLYAHWMTINYRESYNLFCCSGILFNHESPLRGSEFVTKKIVESLTRQCKGSGEVLKLGNIDAKRDWGFAGDYVEAMYLMLQQEIDETGVYVSGSDPQLAGPSGLLMSEQENGIWSLTIDISPGTYTYKFRNGFYNYWDSPGWEPNLPQECGFGQWSDRQFTFSNTDLVLGPYFFGSCEISETSNLQGDVNNDGSLNISDIVLIVSTIIDNEYNPIADFNSDGFVDVIDIVQIIAIILD